MKKLSLQWRITLMTALLICSTCMAMNWLIGRSGRHYMDSSGANLSTAIDPSEGAVEYFDPSREGLDPNPTTDPMGPRTPSPPPTGTLRQRALCENHCAQPAAAGVQRDYCFDGEKALELLGTERYDLVLLDLNLPGADGMTVLRTLRQTDRETRVLILSARSEVADKVEGLDAGANDYLAKSPFI